MNKTGWIICLIVFIFVTVFVLSLEKTTPAGRVIISNHSIQIGHENTEFNNNNVNVNDKNSKISNKNINTSDTNINLNNNNIKYSNSNPDYYNQNPKISNNDKITYKNLDDSKLDELIKNSKLPYPERNKKLEDKFYYKNIDWATWKSNFVNKILDDSINIKELDNYNEGAWFHYSFEVDYEGKINNITVNSIFLSNEDKQRVINLIKSYEYQPITRFPANSKRRYAKVTAIMVMSNHTEKSRPSDFSDSEKVKIKLQQ